MKITIEQARILAQKELSASPDFETLELVLLDARTITRSYGWIFFWQSKKFLETGDTAYAIAGNGPLFVDVTGKVIRLGTKNFEESLQNYQKYGDIYPPNNSKNSDSSSVGGKSSDAYTIALSLAEEHSRILSKRLGSEIIVNDNRTISLSTGWIFLFENKRFFESGELAHSLGSKEMMYVTSGGQAYELDDKHTLQWYVETITNHGSPFPNEEHN